MHFFVDEMHIFIKFLTEKQPLKNKCLVMKVTMSYFLACQTIF